MSTSKTYYSFDPVTGHFTGAGRADASPREPGTFLLPAHATFTAPPEAPAGKVAKMDGETWVLVDAPVEEKAPELTREQLEALARAQRTQLLANCDWTQLADAPLTKDQKKAWADYRAALRDVTAQSGFPTDIQWPALPA